MLVAIKQNNFATALAIDYHSALTITKYCSDVLIDYDHGVLKTLTLPFFIIIIIIIMLMLLTQCSRFNHNTFLDITNLVEVSLLRLRVEGPFHHFCFSVSVAVVLHCRKGHISKKT